MSINPEDALLSTLSWNVNRIAIICPTYNASDLWTEWIEAIKNQSGVSYKVLAIDSGSSDGTLTKAQLAGFDVIEIPNSEFNHGGTRNIGAEYFGDDVDYFVFLTQDSLLDGSSNLKNILKPFENPKIGAVCGRQLPHLNAKPIEAHARLFNYPSTSSVKSKDDIARMGIKTVFMSNSFAAYRRSAFEEAGGFPINTIFAEDMSLAAKMILKGWKVAFCADAVVRHSHSYSILAEFGRYFDIGVFYYRERWISEQFGRAGGEGIRFVISEIQYLLNPKYFYLIPEALLRTIVKYIAFKLGGIERLLSSRVKRRLGMNKGYWK